MGASEFILLNTVHKYSNQFREHQQNIFFLNSSTGTAKKGYSRAGPNPLHCCKNKKKNYEETLQVEASLNLILVPLNFKATNIKKCSPCFAQNLTDNCWNTFSSILDDLEHCKMSSTCSGVADPDKLKFDIFTPRRANSNKKFKGKNEH